MGYAVQCLTEYYPLLKEALKKAFSISSSPFFHPGYSLPELTDSLIEYLSVGTISDCNVGTYNNIPLRVLNLFSNPETQTTKTFPSLIMVARAIAYIQETGESILIVTPSSGNKAIALRNAVERAIAYKLVEENQLKIISILPKSSTAKIRNTKLSLKDNPIFIYEGERGDSYVKEIGKDFVLAYKDRLKKDHDLNVWYSLDINNYKTVDIVRAFYENDYMKDSLQKKRLHAHSVSSAYGLLGYNYGRRILEQKGIVSEKTHPSYFLIQHLATPDMVLDWRFGSFSLKNLPPYAFNPRTGLYEQPKDPHFPFITRDPNEILESTFYTHSPQTSQEMKSLIAKHGGSGIVVSREECLHHFDNIRERIGFDSIPKDPDDLLEWSLIMAFTGIFNAFDRNLIPKDIEEIVIHGSGLYTKQSINPINSSQLKQITSLEDIWIELSNNMVENVQNH